MSNDIIATGGTVASEPAPKVRLISKREVLERIPLSYPSIWSRMRAGTFPRSRELGGKTVWIEREIDEWIAGLPVKKLKGDAEEAVR